MQKNNFYVCIYEKDLCAELFILLSFWNLCAALLYPEPFYQNKSLFHFTSLVFKAINFEVYMEKYRCLFVPEIVKWVFAKVKGEGRGP